MSEAKQLKEADVSGWGVSFGPDQVFGCFWNNKDQKECISMQEKLWRFQEAVWWVVQQEHNDWAVAEKVW